MNIHDLDKDELYKINHSAEHVFAQAVKELYGDRVQLAVAHIESDSFSNDSEWAIEMSDKMFNKIEKKMNEIIEADLPIVREEITQEQAEEMFKNNPFKLEWVAENVEKGNALTIYKNGDEYFDLCKGPHVESTGKIGAVKLMRVSGAYWRGDEENEMLTRVYGTAWPSQEALDAYLEMLEEAKKRDHRKLGQELGLFTFSDLVGAGLPMFTPKGTLLRMQLQNFSEELQKNAGYQQVWIPHIAKKDLYETSGHWDKFGDELFLVTSQETDDTLVLKPMNCPHHAQIYSSEQRSYRDLPLRLFESTTIYRDEKKGELQGLSRVRSITQDDAHVFCRVDQIEQEFQLIMEMIQKMYGALGLEFKARLSFRDDEEDKYHGNPKNWEKAQRILEDVAKNLDLEYEIIEGEAAFYGPKIDIMVYDALGREWQCATEQLDFVQPERFGLTYVDENGEEQTPVMIHKALLGSIERFLSIYIEHTAGAFPVWLHPEQVAIIPVSDKFQEYADTVSAEIKEVVPQARIQMFSEPERIQKKIRKAQMMKIPYMLVVGGNEEESGKVNVRLRSEEQLGEMSIAKFAERLKERVDTKSLEL